MKKVLFGIAFLGAMAFAGVSVNAQSSLDPEGGNSYGGVCCQSDESCQHPRFGNVADSTWVGGISFCP